MKDFVVSVVFMFISLFAFFGSSAFSRSGKNEFSLANNPAMYPRLLAAVMFILSCVFLFQALRKGALKNVKIQIDREKTIKVLRLLFVIVVYVIGIYFIGYIISSIICVFLFILIFDGKIIQAIISSVGATVILYLVFRIIFNIPLPMGYFFE